MLRFVLRRSLKEIVELEETLRSCLNETLGLTGMTFTNWGAGYNGKSEKIFATDEICCVYLESLGLKAML